ncbi:MAG: peptidoglycan-binding protein [Firmicutes bacterium]|nr:peptidoglycan-binding protein [Bacillota bacterium]
MAIASNFLIGGNDEHGLNPPTAGKRSPVMPYINRSFYENEFNVRAKNRFLEACLRTGFNVFDVKPEVTDVPVSTRVSRVNTAGVRVLVNFGYNAYGDGNTFNSARGYYVYYAPTTRYGSASRELSQKVFDAMLNNGYTPARSVSTLSGVGVLQSVNCPSTLLEAGFMTNFEEAKLMVNPNYTLAAGERACVGVCEYFGVPYVRRDNLSAYPLLSLGQRGNSVQLLQRLLNQYGANLPPEGTFGPLTQAAVMRFQRDNNLRVDGIAGRNTWTALLNLFPAATTVRQGSRTSNVLYLQELLLSFLYEPGPLDGIFGPRTHNAVLAFQRENRLVADGIVGPITWRALLSSTGRPMP